jgi:hypothetical protein
MATFTRVGNLFIRVQETNPKYDYIIPITETKFLKSNKKKKYSIIVYSKYHDQVEHHYITEELRDTAYDSLLALFN